MVGPTAWSSICRCPLLRSRHAPKHGRGRPASRGCSPLDQPPDCSASHRAAVALTEPRAPSPMALLLANQSAQPTNAHMASPVGAVAGPANSRSRSVPAMTETPHMTSLGQKRQPALEECTDDEHDETATAANAVGGGMAPPDQQSAALLLAAGVVAADGAALLGFAGWFLLPRTSEEPSNRGAFPRRDRVRRADGSCSCWLSPSRCGDRSDGLRCRRSPSAARARRDPPVGHSGLWPGAMLLGLARCGGAACAVLGASSGRAGSVMRLSCGAP